MHSTGMHPDALQAKQCQASLGQIQLLCYLLQAKATKALGRAVHGASVHPEALRDAADHLFHLWGELNASGTPHHDVWTARHVLQQGRFTTQRYGGM